MIKILEHENYLDYKKNRMVKAKVKNLKNNDIFNATFTEESFKLQMEYESLIDLGVSEQQVEKIQQLVLDYGQAQYSEGFDNGYDSGCESDY